MEYDGQGITLVRADEYRMRTISSLRLVTCDTPLLKGTMRQAMLDKGLLVERDITLEYCRSCREVSLINAMMPLGRCVVHLSTDTLSV